MTEQEHGEGKGLEAWAELKRLMLTHSGPRGVPVPEVAIVEAALQREAQTPALIAAAYVDAHDMVLDAFAGDCHDEGDAPSTKLAERMLQRAPSDAQVALDAMLEKARAEERCSMEGHDAPCYYCNEPCSAVAGDPGRWPISLCHADDPGVVKWHHIGCVSQRLQATPQVAAAFETAAVKVASITDADIRRALDTFTGSASEAMEVAAAAVRTLTDADSRKALDAMLEKARTEGAEMQHSHHQRQLGGFINATRAIALEEGRLEGMEEAAKICSGLEGQFEAAAVRAAGGNVATYAYMRSDGARICAADIRDAAEGRPRPDLASFVDESVTAADIREAAEMADTQSKPFDTPVTREALEMSVEGPPHSSRSVRLKSSTRSVRLKPTATRAVDAEAVRALGAEDVGPVPKGTLHLPPPSAAQTPQASPRLAAYLALEGGNRDRSEAEDDVLDRLWRMLTEDEIAMLNGRNG